MNADNFEIYEAAIKSRSDAFKAYCENPSDIGMANYNSADEEASIAYEAYMIERYPGYAVVK